MTTEKKKQKSKTHNSGNSTQLEVRIPRVQQMDDFWNKSERKVKISYLMSHDATTQKTETVQDDNDEIKKRLDLCHETLQENNEMLTKAANSLKKLDFKSLRKQLKEGRQIDTAECLLRDEEDLKRNRELLEKQLVDLRRRERDKNEVSKNFSDSLNDIVQTFRKVKEQASKQ